MLICFIIKLYRQTLTIQTIRISGPDKPTNFQVTGAMEGQVTLTWSEPLYKNGILTQYLLTYQELPSGPIYKEERSTDETFLTLSNLSPSSIYIFKLYAVTIVGQGEPAEVKFDFSYSEY